MPTKQTTKPLEGVSFAEFARIINRTKGYISQMKSANRLVLTSDGKRVLVDESRARIKATSDPSKWPLTMAHEAERRRKVELQESAPELKPDPYHAFLMKLFSDATVHICAELMLVSGMSLQQAAHSFHAVCAAIVQTRENAGYKSELWRLPSPLERCTPSDWRATIQAEIEQMVRRESAPDEEAD
jgi:hypothetical protein